MHYYSIFKRLLLGLWALLFVVLIVPFAYFSYTLEDDLRHDAHDTAVNDLNSVEWVLSQQKFSGLAELDAWTEAYGAVTGQRISYIVGDRLAADSNIAFGDLGATESHSARPEVMQALRDGLSVKLRYSTTINKNFIYAAKPTTKLQGVPMGVIRLAIPTSSLSEHVSRGRWGLLGMFVASMLVGGVICWLMVKALMRNINGMASAAQRIGAGNYNARMYEVRGRELRPLVTAINDMAHNIQTHLETLNERNSRLEALFAALHEGVVVVDFQGHVLAANPAAVSLFPALAGLDNRPASASEPLMLMEATMLPSLQDAVETLRAREQRPEPGQNGPESDENSLTPDQIAQIGPDSEAVAPTLGFSLQTESGAQLEAVLTVFGSRPGGGILAVFRDVSEKERLERLRRDFVANVSHELKTPLTSIKGYTEALLDMEKDSGGDEKAGPPRRQFLQTIARNAEHMNKIVQGLLLLARAEHHGETATLENVDVAPLLREAARNKRLLAGERDLSLRLSERAEEADAVFVRGLADGLSEVFHNILDNALKYADNGTAIDVDLETTDDEAVIAIKNMGPAIPAEQQERIFERFYRLDRDGNLRKAGSAGLGLAICKRTVMGFGGRIWVESPVAGSDKGVVFYVALRLGS